MYKYLKVVPEDSTLVKYTYLLFTTEIFFIENIVQFLSKIMNNFHRQMLFFFFFLITRK